jgi:hypothetical protein
MTDITEKIIEEHNFKTHVFSDMQRDIIFHALKECEAETKKKVMEIAKKIHSKHKDRCRLTACDFQEVFIEKIEGLK